MKKVISALVLAGFLFYSNVSFALTPAELRTMVTEADEAFRWADFEKAMELCNEIIKADPNYAAAYAVRAAVLFNSNPGNDDAWEDVLDNAQSDAIKATELPSDGYLIDLAYYWLARFSFEYLLTSEHALEFITEAIKLTQDDPFDKYYELRSEIYKSLGKTELSDQDKAKVDQLRAGVK